MFLHIDPQGEEAIYLQIYKQIILGIAKGELCHGEQLPTVRQLASDIAVNNMTVSKAYALLKEEGYINTNRRQGAVVCQRAVKKEDIKDDINKELELLAGKAKIAGLLKEEFLMLCDKAYSIL